ncbi:hypothetical protein OLL83_003059 [Shewanella algae]|uniref:hypothetical protein n=1 Tax=Shewanella algae TaxID=38313 RepID=UPI00222E9D85|nr:hypothetical protein [Shewanella algae]UZD57291.1 hypothetical protein OLL83_003059 [Shewanella algae]
MLQNKWLHVINLAVVAIGSLLLFIKYPEFYNDAQSTFSTLGGIVTFYSLMVAVVELLRTKGVAFQAKEEASKAASRVEKLYAIKDLSTCQSSVEMALDAIEKNDHIPTSTLCYITKVYCQIFHEELSLDDSKHRRAKSVVDSYSFASKEQKNGKNTNKNKLKTALLEILEHVSSEVGKQTKEN